MGEHDPKSNLMAVKHFFNMPAWGTRFTEWSKLAAMRPKQQIISYSRKWDGLRSE
jgi:hypothetical protein